MSFARSSLGAIGWLFLAAVSAATALWLAESLHWSGSLLAALRPYLGLAALVALVVLLLARRPRAGLAAGSLAAWNLAPVLLLYLPPPSAVRGTGAELTLVTANLREGNVGFAPLLDWIAREEPDLVALQEVQASFHAALAASGLDYPHRYFWPATPDPTAPREMGLALLSRLPFERIELVWGDWLGRPILEAELQVAGQRVVVLVAHTMRPGRAESTAACYGMLRGLAERARAFPRVILVGDLNATATQPIFADLLQRANLVDSRRGFGWQPSWRSSVLERGLPLDLDHVLASPDVGVLDRRLGPDFGSDHLPVLARVAF